MHRRLVYIYLLNVPSFCSRYFNKIKRTRRLGRLLALSLEILASIPWKVSDLESLSSSPKVFFLFSLSFCSSRKLEFLMFYVKAFFFYLARAQFVCKRIQSKHHADAVQMQKIHSLCKQEKEVGLTISLDQAKERASTEARVSLSG